MSAKFAKVFAEIFPDAMTSFEGFPNRKMRNDTSGSLGISSQDLYYVNNKYYFDTGYQDDRGEKLIDMPGKLAAINNPADLRESLQEDGYLYGFIAQIERVWSDLFLCAEMGLSVDEIYDALKKSQHSSITKYSEDASKDKIRCYLSYYEKY